MRYDFADLQALQSKARRERAEAMYEMFIAPLVGAFIRAKTKKRIAHAPRPHLARQG